MKKILTALILTISMLTFLVPHACCCQTVRETVAQIRAASSCCHAAESVDAAKVLDSGTRQIKEQCRCELSFHLTACLSSETDFYSRYQEVLPDIRTFELKNRCSEKETEEIANLKRGPPDFEAIKTSRTYLINKVIRC